MEPIASHRHPFFLLLLTLATLGFGLLLLGFWKPVFWAVVLGVLFRPVERRVVEGLGGRRNLGAALTLLLIVLTVLLPALLVASLVAAEAAGLYQRINSGEIDLRGYFERLEAFAPRAVAWLEGLGVNVDEIPATLTSVAVTGSRYVGQLALSAGQNVAVFIVMFFLMLYLLFFVLRDADQIMARLYAAMPLPDELEQRLLGKFAEVARATIKGTLVVGLIQGTLGGIIFAILGIEGAIFWGVVMVALSILPAVGAGIIWIPAAVLLLADGQYVSGIVLIAFGVLVIGLVDNLLRPILVGRDTRMPDYLVLLSTLGGLALVGITGFVLGPVIAALFLATWQVVSDERAEPRDRSKDGEAARDPETGGGG